ncbi:MAG TPA: pyridoxal-phosphate dependent enzyme [Candidatus Binatia bacterium]|nr:pyridoxal-phosphate dependent enzyme [Candidatus Binatia bacterium]
MESRERTSVAPSYCETALDAVGKTPLVRVRRVAGELPALVLAKLEYLNPGGSTKDRIAVAMIEHAERSGLLRPGGTIVEPTSGNTGTALAMAAAIRGYRCILVVPEKTSSEKITTMRAFGAEVVVAPPVTAGSPQAYTAIAARIVREIPGAYMPDQYVNPVNPLAHERTTGVEIWDQTAGKVTHVVAGIGTGGTICGIARALKARNPRVCIVGADPVGSIYSGGMPDDIVTEGIGRHYLPKTLDLRLIDRMERVSDREAFAMARRAAREEGLLVGGSSGAALVATARVARELGAEAVVVVILPDSARAYYSKMFDDAWMEKRGFSGLWAMTLGDVVRSAENRSADAFVGSGITLREAEAIMRDAGVDELAVVDDDCHVGRVGVQAIVDVLRVDRKRFDATVATTMGPPFPIFEEAVPVDEAYRALRLGQSRVVVVREGRPIAMLGARDLVAYAMNA